MTLKLFFWNIKYRISHICEMLSDLIWFRLAFSKEFIPISCWHLSAAIQLLQLLMSSILPFKPDFHIIVSDWDVPASMGTWQRCIGDILKSRTDPNFSHLGLDVGDTTGTSATSPKMCSHIIISVLVASPFNWLGRVPVTYDDMETRL